MVMKEWVERNSNRRKRKIGSACSRGGAELARPRSTAHHRARSGCSSVPTRPAALGLRFGEAMHVFGPGQRFVVGLEYARIDHVAVSANRHGHRTAECMTTASATPLGPSGRRQRTRGVWSCVIVGVPDQAEAQNRRVNVVYRARRHAKTIAPSSPALRLSYGTRPTNPFLAQGYDVPQRYARCIVSARWQACPRPGHP